MLNTLDSFGLSYLPFSGASARDAVLNPYRREERYLNHAAIQTYKTLRRSNPLTNCYPLQLGLFMNLPWDIQFEILTFLHPIDLLQLTRVCKNFRSVFLSRTSESIWRAALKNNASIPNCPAEVPFPKWTSLLFDPFRCDRCNTERAIPDFARYRRVCNWCQEYISHSGSPISRLFSREIYSQFPEEKIRILNMQIQAFEDEATARNLDIHSYTDFIDFQKCVLEDANEVMVRTRSCLRWYQQAAEEFRTENRIQEWQPLASNLAR